jgi:hypothetical protein
MQSAISYCNVRYKISKYLIAGGYDIFKNKCVFIGDLSDLTLRIIFDAWEASMNVGLKLPIAWNNSGHAPS